MNPRLIYVHDPMCSWCYAFEPVRRQLFSALDGRMPIERLVGGLAPDSGEPMPAAMRQMLQQTWRRIEQVVPGTRFNYDFWQHCEPRRSTYPANRAVLAARAQGAGFDETMTGRIQRAYYREARNPSDDETLIELATDIGLDAARFAADLKSPRTRAALLDEIGRARALGADSFPSLIVADDGRLHRIGIDYNDAGAMLREIESIGSGSG